MSIDADDTDYSIVVMGQIPNARIEIGYLLEGSVWGLGYATEVYMRMLQFAFREAMLKEAVAALRKLQVAVFNQTGAGIRYLVMVTQRS